MTGQKKEYVTLSAHRWLSKEAIDFDGKECFVNSDGTQILSILSTRPKFYSEGGGTT